MKSHFLLTWMAMFMASWCLGQNPRLLRTNPLTAKQGEKLSVTISGSRTHFAQASQTVSYLSQGSNTVIYPYAFSSATNTVLKTEYAIPSGASTGLYDVVVWNEIDGFMSLNQYFYIDKSAVPKGSIKQVTPKKGKRGTTLTVSISGRKTRFTQASQTQVYLTKGSSDLVNGYSVKVKHDSLLTAEVSIPSTASLGMYDVHVFLPNVDYYLKIEGFEVSDKPSPPVNAYLSPDSAFVGKTTSISVHAKGGLFTKSSSTNITLIGKSGVMSPSNISIGNDTTISFDLTLSSSADTGLFDVRIEQDYYNGPIDIFDGLRIMNPVSNETPIGHLLEVYPNPVAHQVTVRIPDHINHSRLKLLNTTGQVVLDQKLNTKEGATVTLDLSAVPVGFYIIRLYGDQKEFSAPIHKL